MDYLSGWCTSKKRLEGCTAIVTGCNTGIGKETALDFYKRGARVIMACRNLEKAEAAKSEIEKKNETLQGKGTLIIETLDLCSFKSVKDFAAKVLSSEDRVNILVNNAGVMMCPQGKTEDGFETHIGSNHYGHALLTFLLLPVIARSAPARIVNVSSYLHERFDLPLDDINFERSPYDAFAAYCRSKAANVLFAKAFARQLKEHSIQGVSTYSVHPGVIRTDISRHFDKTVWFGASWAFNNILGWFLKSPVCGAQTTIYCAVDERCAEETGLYYSDCAPKLPSKQCQDDAVADQFWTLTVESLNYDPFKEDGLLAKKIDKQKYPLLRNYLPTLQSGTAILKRSN